MAEDKSSPVSSRSALCDDVYAMLPQFLNPRDIKAFRLVNRDFADFGVKWLVRDVRVDFRRSSFKRLEQISNRPLMARHVRSIAYFRPVVWEGDRDYEAWRSETERSSWSEEELAEGHREVVGVLEEQAAIARVGLVSTRIKTAVERLHGLRSITMVTGSPDRIRKVSDHRTLLGFGQDPGIESYQGKWEFTNFMTSARAARLQELRAGKLDCSFFTSAVVEKAGTWWRWIRVLELELLRCGPKVSTEGLKGFLTGLPGLEKLGISFDPHSEPGCAQLRDVIDTKGRWENLTELRAYGVRCSGEELLELLRKHKECKLERVKMACVELEPGDDWTRVMMAIRGLKLDDVKIAGWVKSGRGRVDAGRGRGIRKGGFGQVREMAAGRDSDP